MLYASGGPGALVARGLGLQGSRLAQCWRETRSQCLTFVMAGVYLMPTAFQTKRQGVVEWAAYSGIGTPSHNSLARDRPRISARTRVPAEAEPIPAAAQLAHPQPRTGRPPTRALAGRVNERRKSGPRRSVKSTTSGPVELGYKVGPGEEPVRIDCDTWITNKSRRRALNAIVSGSCESWDFFHHHPYFNLHGANSHVDSRYTHTSRAFSKMGMSDFIAESPARRVRRL